MVKETRELPDNTYAVYLKKDDRLLSFVDAENYEIALNKGSKLHARKEWIYVMKTISVIIEP